MTVIIGPPLYLATTRALGTFRRHFPPRIFPLLEVDSPERDAYIRDWARELIGVTLDAIPDAAQRWVGDERHLGPLGRVLIPNAASFARYARALDRAQYRPHLVARAPAPTQVGAKTNTEALTNRAMKVLQDARQVREVWGLLWAACTTDAERARVRAGAVSLADFDDAVRIVQESAPLPTADPMPSTSAVA